MVKPMNRQEIAAEIELHEIADACFAYLVQDPEELARFMAHAGYDPATLTGAVGSVSLAHGMIDYFATSQPALLALCANASIPPQRFTRVWEKLNGQM